MTTISKEAFDTVLAACSKAYPIEACGLLIGTKDTILSAEPCRNIAPEKKHSFQIDPRFHLRLQREAREKGLKIIGTFHSHPDGKPEPSSSDREGLCGDYFFHLICAVAPGKAPGVRLFAVKHQKNEPGPACLANEPLLFRKAVA